MPTPEQLVQAWATLDQLYTEAIAGAFNNREFDPPSALRHSKTVIRMALAEQYGARELEEMLYGELGSRSAVLQS